jgi:multidrug transporter EmrE-like cation transporter
MSTIGVIYSLSTVLLLAALGVILFNESLNRYEVTGIFFAVASILLLSRFG